MEVVTKEGVCVQHISGQFNVRAELQEDGWFRVKYNSATTNYSPWSSSNAQNDVRDMQRTGATIESSQWVGWLPVENECPRWGKLDSSIFSIRNLRVWGTVLTGKEPTKCSLLAKSANFANNAQQLWLVV